MKTKTRKKRMRSTAEVRLPFYCDLQHTIHMIQMSLLLSLRARETRKVSGGQRTTYDWTDATESSTIKTSHG